jgi:hypothetical protein
MSKKLWVFVGSVVGLALGSCSEPENVLIVEADLSLVSCNNQSNPASLALYVDFAVQNVSDVDIDVVAVELMPVEKDNPVVVGRQTLTSAVSVEAGATKAFGCKDGFTVVYPGENTLTEVRLEVVYRVDGAEMAMVRYVQMDTTVAWDNCGGFLGNAKVCAAK